MVLTNSEFLLHQAMISSGYDGMQFAQDQMYSGLAMVVASSDPYVEADLLNSYYANATDLEQGKITMLKQATSALVTHVTTRTGLQFNTYLSTNGLKVSPQFAELSDSVGVPVDDSNIQY
jgi:hypothetical protein